MLFGAPVGQVDEGLELGGRLLPPAEAIQRQAVQLPRFGQVRDLARRSERGSGGRRCAARWRTRSRPPRVGPRVAWPAAPRTKPVRSGVETGMRLSWTRSGSLDTAALRRSPAALGLAGIDDRALVDPDLRLGWNTGVRRPCRPRRGRPRGRAAAPCRVTPGRIGPVRAGSTGPGARRCRPAARSGGLARTRSDPGPELRLGSSSRRRRSPPSERSRGPESRRLLSPDPREPCDGGPEATAPSPCPAAPGIRSPAVRALARAATVRRAAVAARARSVCRHVGHLAVWTAVLDGTSERRSELRSLLELEQRGPVECQPTGRRQQVAPSDVTRAPGQSRRAGSGRQWPGPKMELGRPFGLPSAKSGGVLLSQGRSSQVPSALEGLTSVFGMGTGVTPPLWPPKTCCQLTSGAPVSMMLRATLEDFIASTNDFVQNPSPRPISTGQLNTLLCLHFRPINVVVFHGPYQVNPVGGLILEEASRLDAFSGYPFRRSLTSHALGRTTGTRELRPSRSSRTRDSFPQSTYGCRG